MRLPFGEGLVGMAAERREPLAVKHASEHPAYRYFPETGEERFESLMAVPLLVREVPIGVLSVQTIQPRLFDPRDVELLQTCAQLIAPVVMNARLLEHVTKGEEERAQVTSQLQLSGLQFSDIEVVRPDKNVELRGIPAARGIAIGPVYRLQDPIDLAHLDYTPSSDARQEQRDLSDALVEARRELDAVREDVSDRFGVEFAAVFNTHIQILEDKGFVAKLESEVQRSGNALDALRAVLDDYRRIFERIEDPYFRERGTDIMDVGQRVMARLLGVRHQEIELREGSVVVANQILPGHFALLDIDKVAAIVSEHGGPTSHGAIFARALEVPSVTGVSGIQAAARVGETAVVDGTAGTVYLSPEEGLLSEYRRAQERYAIAAEHLDALRDRPAETRDGRRLVLTANIGFLSELRLIDRHGAEGIGLFRTELLALVHRGFPLEEEQEQLYERVAGEMAPRTVTLRTLDLGGDKEIPSIGLGAEENPQLGCRSIRLSLENLQAFRAQLRAIYRASAKGNLRLLLPMISSLHELRRARAAIEEVKEELRRAGTPFDAEIPVGVMIEVPAAALTAEALAAECDFFSIGTNDLTQYTLAVDRGNERVAHLYDPLHPAVLALIDRTVRAAARAGIPVSLCGEMASNPLAVPILVGLGIGELSGAPGAVPVVKEIVRALEWGDVAEDARRALAARTVEEVRAIGAARLRQSRLTDHPDIGSWLSDVVRTANSTH